LITNIEFKKKIGFNKIKKFSANYYIKYYMITDIEEKNLIGDILNDDPEASAINLIRIPLDLYTEP